MSGHSVRADEVVALRKGTLLKNLFSEGKLSQVLRNRELKMLDEIKQAPAKDLVLERGEALIARHRIEPLKIHKDSSTATTSDVEIDISKDPNFGAFHSPINRGPVYKQGTRVTYHVPFTGDRDLFRFTPNAYTQQPPVGNVSNTEVKFEYDRMEIDLDEVQRTFDADLKTLTEWAIHSTRDVSEFNQSLEPKGAAAIEARLKKVANDQAIAEQLNARSGHQS